MNAIVLAGGYGTRLRPLTDFCPKPMLKIANRPVLDYVVAQLAHYGLNDIVFTLGYMPGRVRDFASSYRGVRTRFSVETIPLGTAGGVKSAESMLDDVFVVASGDCLSDIDLAAMTEAHLASGAEVTLAAVEVSDPTRYGVVTADEGGRVRGFIEKPDSDRFGRLVNAGVYVVNKSVLRYIPRGAKFDFSRDLFPGLADSGTLYAYRHGGYWCDVGDKASFFAANFFMAENGGFFPPVRNVSAIFGSERRDGSLVSRGAVTVGRVSRSIIGDGARIASCGGVDNCVVLDGATVKERLSGAIVGADFVEKIPLAPAAAEKRDENYGKYLNSGA